MLSRSTRGACRSVKKSVRGTDGIAVGSSAVSPCAAFRGGIRSAVALGSGVSFPFGHLAFDQAELSIFGAGWHLNVQRNDVRWVRISPGILAVKVSVIGTDGTQRDPYFAALSRGLIRAALIECGWPIIEDRRLGTYRPT